jgi:hypothetical protein
MAKAGRKRTTPLDLSPVKWAPLIEAFERAKACLGSRRLALLELLMHLGDEDEPLRSAEKRITPTGIQVRLTKPQEWRDANDSAKLNRMLFVVNPDAYGFVLRRDLDRLYPAVATEPAHERPGSLKPLPATKPAGIGPKIWRVAQVVVELGNVGPLDELLKMIRSRLKESVSDRTLDSVLRFLRDGDFIDW